MEPDEVKPQSPAAVLPREDLSLFSLKELRDRVAMLESEIDRCKQMIADKEGARTDAEAFFRK